MRHEWAVDDETRYGVYVLSHKPDHPRVEPIHLYATSKEGIGTALVQGREDEDITPSDRVGIMDGFEGKWVVNPFAKGRTRRPRVL